MTIHHNIEINSAGLSLLKPSVFSAAGSLTLGPVKVHVGWAAGEPRLCIAQHVVPGPHQPSAPALVTPTLARTLSLTRMVDRVFRKFPTTVHRG